MTKESAARDDGDFLSTVALSSVHDALQDAVLAEDRVSLVNIIGKAHPAKKAAAEAILERHGATMSSFLRACVDRLVLDFGGPKLAAKLEAEE